MESKTVLLENLSWPAIESAQQGGMQTVIVPSGSVEQHGPHLGIVKDAAWAEALAIEVAEELGDALVAPTIRPGCSEHHMAFPGTISYRPETLMRVLEDYCHSIDAHGFEHIVVLSMHGGNFPSMNAILPSLSNEVDAEIISLLDKNLMMEPLMEALAAHDIPEEARGHGGAAVTASVWHLLPELVDQDEFEPGYMGDVSTTNLMAQGLQAFSEAGHMGDPTRATLELGEDVTDGLVQAFVEEIRRERGTDTT